MKVAIMQPYFFPYLGYFQLIQAVDLFVVLDDVNFINRGWINRNRIIKNEKDVYITLKLQNKSQNKLINELMIFEAKKSKQQILRMIVESYAKTKYFEAIFPGLEKIISYEEERLAEYLIKTLRDTCELMKIKTKFIKSSDIDRGKKTKGEERILFIAKQLGADTYINLSGGRELYSKDTFRKAGISLLFIQQNNIHYKQFTEQYIPYLSIIDTLMFNDIIKIKQLVKEYTLS